jgi:hypothetical protein
MLEMAARVPRPENIERIHPFKGQHRQDGQNA